MYPELQELGKYTTVDALLVAGLSTVLFLIGSIFVTCGAAAFSWYFSIGRYFLQTGFPPGWTGQFILPPSFFVEGLISTILTIPYINAVTIVWIVGVLLMITGLMGYASFVRLSILKLLKRKH